MLLLSIIGLNNCLVLILCISLATTEGNPPLARWHAIGIKISLDGKE